MALKVIHICDLQGLKFNIPSYQRGYRWEEKHVKALLNDLFDFSKSNDPFYCLQPLVVVKNVQLSSAGQTVYDVIDGQQRLTTIYLILHSLGIPRLKDYSLRYERLAEGASTTYDDDRVLSYAKLSCLSDREKSSVADYFYMSRAIECIQRWLEEKAEQFNSPEDILKGVLYPMDFEKSDYLCGGTEDKNANLKDVRFIWYEADDEEIKKANVNISPIATFRRLNHGKTSLTAAELIKSLLFQCDLYREKKNVYKEIAFRRSTEWNEMEIRLQNPFFWSMLCPDEYDRPSHIDLVLSFVSSELSEKIPNGLIKSEESYKDTDYDYLVFDSYLNGDGNANIYPSAYAEKVEYVWSRIQDVYSMFLSWFEDREIYHRIGLLLALKHSKGNQHLSLLKKLREEFETSTREAFLTFLKQEIARIIKLGKEDTLSTIDYENNWKEIVNILLVFNVEATLSNSADSQLFPFDFYRRMTPSLEHIHPQHLDNEDIGFEDLCRWYADKRDALKSSKSESELACLASDLDVLDTYLTLESGEKEYKKHPECQSAIQDIDKYFDTLAGIDSTKLHAIDNMALIDKETNSALGNKLLDKKREKLLERARLYESTKGEDKREGAYVMRGTWQVFNKEFNNDVKDLKFWTESDRKAYFAAIEKVYNAYVLK